MRILFDQGTPIAIRSHLKGHIVRTAREEGWSTLSNGDLLLAAEGAGFEVLLTTDTNLPHQQDLKNRKLGFVVLSRNRWKSIKRNLPTIVAAVKTAQPGTCTIVEIPKTA